MELATSVKVTTPVVDIIPAALSSTAPALGEEVTLTCTDAAFSSNPDGVLVGLSAIMISVAADGSSISFVPAPAATGNVIVDGVTIAGFSLLLPAKQPSITVPPATPIAGTESPATGAWGSVLQHHGRCSHHAHDQHQLRRWWARSGRRPLRSRGVLSAGLLPRVKERGVRVPPPEPSWVERASGGKWSVPAARRWGFLRPISLRGLRKRRCYGAALGPHRRS